MKPKLITFKFLMKDNTLNKSPNKELNMFQSQDQLLNIKLLPTPVMFQFKNNTLTINKSNTSLNMFQTLDKKPKLTIFLNKELNSKIKFYIDMLIINQSKEALQKLLQLSNNQWSNNHQDNQLLLDKQIT